jgi:hypothetical protein
MDEPELKPFPPLRYNRRQKLEHSIPLRELFLNDYAPTEKAHP